jgi:hypothetical protein
VRSYYRLRSTTGRYSMSSLTQALAEIPLAALRDDLRSAYGVGGSVVDSLLERPEIRPSVALMAGLALDPRGRAAFERVLDLRSRPLDVERDSFTWPEVIVGGGAHAATYASVRVSLGFPRPLVIERAARYGGTFAMTERPTFYLNSRNRPGALGAPGSRDALNLIPAAPMQPSDIGASEYQSNADLGLVIRCALAFSSTIRQAEVERIERIGNDGAPIVVLVDGRTIRPGRVIVATGIGEERSVDDDRPVEPDGSSILGYADLMRRLDVEPFPLRGLGRVAVIGAGDGARTAIEALTGIGPSAGRSTIASLDYVERIDWYGCESRTRDEYLSCNRTRYARIGALLPRSIAAGSTENARVITRPRARSLAPGYLSATVDGRTYDTVVVATGYRRRTLLTSALAETGYRPNGVTLGRISLDPVTSAEDDRVVRIGAAARIPFEGDESDSIRENAVGLYRLAPRTATLAAMLPAPGSENRS